MRLPGREDNAKFLARPLDRSACFVGKSSPKSMRLALGRDWSARPIVSLYMAARIFFFARFAEPSKQRDYSRIVLMSSGGIILLDVNASCKKQRGPVMFSMALCTEASSLSRFCVYFRNLGGKT